MYLRVGEDQNGRCAWWLHDDSDTVIAWSGGPCDSTEEAHQAATEFRESAADARYEVYEDIGETWRWRAWRMGHRIATSSETFEGLVEAEQAARAVRSGAGAAVGP
ncbi:MAG: hypothetical protein HOQ22_02275 [Nocardioidaceae bacterium]|nr:hypothetical protein [Nocardioidaceae bacterium]NUS49851.1 hypothetical protein [Nocardioidaceae bacterium]